MVMGGTEQGYPALVRQSTAQYPCFRVRSHYCKCRSFVAAHRLASLLPLPIWVQRRCVSTRCRPAFNGQRSIFNSSRLAPHSALRIAWAGGMIRRLSSHILPPFPQRQVMRQMAGSLFTPLNMRQCRASGALFKPAQKIEALANNASITAENED